MSLFRLESSVSVFTVLAVAKGSQKVGGGAGESSGREVPGKVPSFKLRNDCTSTLPEDLGTEL